MSRILACFIAMALALSCMACIAEDDHVPAKIDMTKWQYEAEDDVYWQVGISYAATPVPRLTADMKPWASLSPVHTSQRPTTGMAPIPVRSTNPALPVNTLH